MEVSRHGKSKMILEDKLGPPPVDILGGNFQPPKYDVEDGAQTPPRGVQGHNEDIPLVEDLPATFQHADESTTFRLSDIDQDLYEKAREWFKSKIRMSTELTVAEMKKTRFQEDRIHDLMYDRLKLLRTGLNPNSDENTYTSFWIAPDFVALQTGVPGLISSGFINENHFGPSAWRRSLARGTQSSRKNMAKCRRCLVGKILQFIWLLRNNQVLQDRLCHCVWP